MIGEDLSFVVQFKNLMDAKIVSLTAFQTLPLPIYPILLQH